MRIQFWFLVSFILATTAAHGIASPIAGPVQNTENGSLYFLLSADTWQNSEAEAVTLGGHLVTINDAAEQAWVFSTFGGYGGEDRHLWIGFHDSNFEGQWEWINGDPVTYTNWDPFSPSPNAGFPTEDYGYMWRPNMTAPWTSGAWDDRRNDEGTTLYGVVEISGPVPVEAVSWSSMKALFR
jgi:hypothetical protein